MEEPANTESPAAEPESRRRPMRAVRPVARRSWWQGPQLVRLMMTGLLLFVVVKFREPCATAASQFVAGFDEPGDKGASGPVVVPPPGQPVVGPGGETFVEITPGMSEQDIEKAFQDLKAQAAARKAEPAAAPLAPTPAATR